MKDAGHRELEYLNFTNVVCVRRNRWYRAVMPPGEFPTPPLEVCMYRVWPGVWHVFAKSFEGSWSGRPDNMGGGLGDVIGSDSEMRSYVRALASAPDTLLRDYDGLYRCAVNARS